jgi:hypothetical protein
MVVIVMAMTIRLSRRALTPALGLSTAIRHRGGRSPIGYADRRRPGVGFAQLFENPPTLADNDQRGLAAARCSARDVRVSHLARSLARPLIGAR